MRALTQFDYHHTLEQSPGITIVIFSQEGCSACRAWTALLTEYQALHPAVNLFTVDVEDEAAISHEMEIFHLPALFLYVNGHYHHPIQCEARIGKLEQAIQQALQLPAQEQP